MNIERFKNGSITTYNEAETIFIKSLCEEAQRNIYRGFATPYDYGYKANKVGRVTLDEDDDKCSDECEEEYKEAISVYNRFIYNLHNYMAYDSSADENVFRLWKALLRYVENVQTISDYEKNQVVLITWLREYWGAWTESILKEEFKYMNLCSIVLNSLKEFCK